jgi:predicted RNA-binding Zn ribbon-like protein
MATTVIRPPLADLRIIGGDLALDFVNTRSGPRHGPVDAEWLSSYQDFADWARRVGLASDGDTRGTFDGTPGGASADPSAGSAAIAAFARIQACRDDLYEAFLALADGTAPPAPVLRRIQLAYLEALSHAQLAGRADGCAWTWEPGGGPHALLAPLWPIVAAAMQLLTAGPAGQVKPCQACRFMFIDVSKNGSRRWCSMDDCGKAAKIARYLQRRAEARAPRPGAG